MQGNEQTFTVRGRPVNPWLALAALLCGFFMALLDATIMNIAVPNIQQNLHTDLTGATWTLSSYALTFSVLLVTMGRFADQFGRKTVFLFGMVLFTVASALCGLSVVIGDATGTAPIAWLIGFRAFQGVGAAALNAVSLAIITAIFPPDKRAAAMGVWGASAGLSSAFGPVLGGFIIQNLGWTWIFYINIPVCLVGFIMTAMFVPETRNTQANTKIDFLGLTTLTISIFCAVLAIMQGQEWGWGSSAIIGLFIAAAVVFAIFMVIEIFQSHPIVDFKLFQRRSFVLPNLIMFILGLAFQGGFLMTTLYFMNVRGYDEIGASLALMPMPLSLFVVGSVAGRLRVQPRYYGMIGTTLMTISLFSFFFVTAEMDYLQIVWRCIIFGVGMALVFQCMPALVLSEVPREKLGVGSGIFNTFRQIGMTLGVAIVISILLTQLNPRMETAKQHAITMVQEDSKLPAQMRDQIVQALAQADANQQNDQKQKEIDLTPLADRVPDEQARPQVREELAALSARIKTEFQDRMTEAFSVTFLVSAFAGLAALLIALFLPLVQRAPSPATPQVKEEATIEPVGAH